MCCLLPMVEPLSCCTCRSVFINVLWLSDFFGALLFSDILKFVDIALCANDFGACSRLLVVALYFCSRRWKPSGMWFDKYSVTILCWVLNILRQLFFLIFLQCLGL